MPFITDEIWHCILKRPHGRTVALSPMPEASAEWTGVDAAIHELPRAVISEVRSLRSLFAVPASGTAPLTLKPVGEAAFRVFSANTHIIAAATRCSVTVSPEAVRPPHSAASVVEGNELFVQLEGLISFEKERARLQKEIAGISSYVASLERKLSNQGFVANAPEDVIEKERSKLSEARSTLEKLSGNLDVLAG
jgi:valyl-tRNA synthetase